MLAFVRVVDKGNITAATRATGRALPAFLDRYRHIKLSLELADQPIDPDKHNDDAGPLARLIPADPQTDADVAVT